MAQDQKIFECFAALNVSVAAGAGRNRRDDVRDLADEHRLGAIEDNYRFVALGRVAVSPA